MAPSSVNERNVLEVYQNLRKAVKKTTNTPRCNVNDYVRISKYKKIFDKGYLPTWSNEIFKIKRVILSSPVIYKLVDLLDEDLDGNFYEEEIQKVVYDEHAAFAIDKILDQKRVGNSIQLLVKWYGYRGYPDKFNSWIDSSVLLER